LVSYCWRAAIGRGCEHCDDLQGTGTDFDLTLSVNLSY
jgi:hypothetical protein